MPFTDFRKHTYLVFRLNIFEGNDIALLELSESASFTTSSRTVCVPGIPTVFNKPNPGEYCVVAGWGATGMYKF